MPATDPSETGSPVHQPLAATWWGHASTTVELGGARVALDPLLGDRLGHLRRRAPAPGPQAARADVVLVSHLHLDHCHLPSLRRFPRDVPVVAPRGGERLVSRSGLRPLPASPGDRLRVAGVEIEVLAAAHDGRRHPWARDEPPALGFRLAAGGASAWYPGDTGPRVDLSGVAPVDLAVVPVGGWGPSLGPDHLDPEQAAAAVARVGARWALPVHWGTFWPLGLRRLAPHTHERLFSTPGDRFAAALEGTGATAVSPSHGVRQVLR